MAFKQPLTHGDLRFMGGNMKNYAKEKTFMYFILICSLFVMPQENEKFNIGKIPAIETITTKSFNLEMPNDPEVILNSIVKRKNSISTDSFNQLGPSTTLGKYEYVIFEKKDVGYEAYNQLIQENNLKIATFGGRYVFINGIVLVKYKDIADLESIAFDYGVSIASNFEGYNTAALKTTDLSLINSLVSQLRQDQRILRARLDFIDPDIVPE